MLMEMVKFFWVSNYLAKLSSAPVQAPVYTACRTGSKFQQHPSILKRYSNGTTSMDVARTTEVISIFLPSLGGGGAQQAMVSLAQGLAARGNIVHMVLANAEGPLLAKIPSAIKIINLSARRSILSLPGLIHYLREHKPRVLLSSIGHTNLLAIWAVRLARLPVKIVIREATTISRSMEDIPKLRGFVLLHLVRWFYPFADKVIATSQGVADDLINFIGVPENLIEVIYTAPSTQYLLSKAHETVNHPWFISGDTPVILAVGRLCKAKDYDTLINAFFIVRKSIEAKLIILGEGKERQHLEALRNSLGLQNDISMPGYVKNPYAYMTRSATFVLSSAWEGLPNVLIEALTLGVPVIATDCQSGPREILADGKYGILVPVGDASVLAQQIINVIMKNKRFFPGKEWTKSFSMETYLDKYTNLLKS